MPCSAMILLLWLGVVLFGRRAVVLLLRGAVALLLYRALVLVRRGMVRYRAWAMILWCFWGDLEVREPGAAGF